MEAQELTEFQLKKIISMYRSKEKEIQENIQQSAITDESYNQTLLSFTYTIMCSGLILRNLKDFGVSMAIGLSLIIMDALNFDIKDLRQEKALISVSKDKEEYEKSLSRKISLYNEGNI